ncbi:MAG TPA: molybdopterin dinucleotide binding domain-containing protein, partial [Anaerolineales bacterium]
AFVAQALSLLAADLTHTTLPQSLANVKVSDAAAASGISESDLQRLAQIFVSASRKVALPGGCALGHTNGLAAAENILLLNILAGNLGQEGGLFMMPDFPIYPDLVNRPSTLAEAKALVDKMNNGQIKTLLVHGANPVYELPKALGFEEAIKKVGQVISFASFPDETALQADYVLPDHTPLESWGYQKVSTGSDRPVVSGLQPVVVPIYNTRSTADVLLAAVQAAGGKLAAALSYSDEVAFLQKSTTVLSEQAGFYSAPDEKAFWTRWQQLGGWWKNAPGLVSPAPSLASDQSLSPQPAAFSGDAQQYPLYLLPFPHPNLGDGHGANRPWLQETPDPMTSVMWNTWVEINPQTAAKLGVQSDDVVKISSPTGTIEAVVYEYPAIHPGVIAIPFGQGHTALGRYAKGRGANPLDLVDPKQNEAGDLAFMATRVKVTPTGRRSPLARYESEEGVYQNKK